MFRRLAPLSMGFAGVAALSTPAAIKPLQVGPDIVPLASSAAAPLRPTAVLVHGLDSSRETFAGTVAALAAAGYPALALDLRGHGESPLGAVDEFSSEALARDVVAAVEARGVAKPWVLVGHSMGGRVAMEVARIAAQEDPGLLAAADLPVEVHLWVAGPDGTVAQWDGADGIDDLAARLPAARVKEFPTASHSIHNTNADEFVADLCAIVDRCR